MIRKGTDTIDPKNLGKSSDFAPTHAIDYATFLRIWENKSNNISINILIFREYAVEKIGSIKWRSEDMSLRNL